MRLIATLALLAVLATPAMAVTVWDESVNGDLSSNAAAPTPIALTGLSSTLIGTMNSVGGADREYITFTVDPDRLVVAINLLGISPDNLAFCSLNNGSVSAVPSAGTIGFFLSGIHVAGPNIGTNLLNDFVSNSVTTNSLGAPFLTSGTYCFLIQQTSPITQPWSIEFENTFVLPTDANTWGAVKKLYR